MKTLNFLGQLNEAHLHFNPKRYKPKKVKQL